MKKALASLVVATAAAAWAAPAGAVSGAAFTTDNIWVDGDYKDVCKNSSINCNIYGQKPDVWLNGGPTANGLGPDGEYFFAVLVPGGQPNPNDGGFKNLSDDYDAYTNRTFTVADGEVVAYGGSHDLDSGNFLNPNRKVCNSKRGCSPDGEPPLIRLFPYADTWNPGGVYILAICSIGDGSDYPVDPRDCKYDAFKVKDGPVTYDLMLSGIKFEDTYADGVKDDSAVDPGLSGWTITVVGTGFAGEIIDVKIITGDGGYWEYATSYTFGRSDTVYDAQLTVCEEMSLEQIADGWHQSYPASVCYDVTLAPAALASVGDLDFGNWDEPKITVCKEQDQDGDLGTTGDQIPVAGWPVSLTDGDTVIDSQVTGADGCFSWTDITPGVAYGVHEGQVGGWVALGAEDWVFETARSGATYQHTFINAAVQGCTPGFWQGGSAGGQAGGQWLWNEENDPEWTASGGSGTNPYVWTTRFNDFFTPYAGLDGVDMMSLVDTGGGADDYNKAARSLVAAYLNASWGMLYAYDTAALSAMWADAVASGEFLSLHTELDAANNAYYRVDGGPYCPIAASGY